MHPRGLKGGSASKTSLTVPMPAWLISVSNPASNEPGSLPVAWVGAKPGIKERANQPSPDRALMICSITRAQLAIVVSLIVGIGRRKGAQTEWRNELVPHDAKHGRPLVFGKNWVG